MTRPLPLLLSLALHAVVVVVLVGRGPMPDPEPDPIEVELVEHVPPPPPPLPPPPPPPEPEAPPPEPEPPPPPPKLKVVHKAPVIEPKPQEPKPEPPAPKGAPEAPLLGTTFEGSSVADNNGTMAVPGAGGGGKGPIGVPSRGRPDGVAKAAPAAVGPPIAIVIKDEPKLLSEVKPAYPEDARSQLIEGKVRLRLVISPDGRVLSARVVKKLHPSLDKAALEAAPQFRFSPAMTNDGRKVEYTIPWNVNFQLDR